MFDPNSPAAKIFLLIAGWIIMFIPCRQVTKESLYRFKEAKTHMKVLKVLRVIPLWFLTAVIMIVIIERVVHFDSWYIGGSK